jgi:hypothetical protein
VGDLTYLIILLVVINIVGRILRALSSSKKQVPGTKAGAAAQPRVRAGERAKDPFAVLAERFEKLSEMEKRTSLEEEPPPHPYREVRAEEFTTKIPDAELPRDFARETGSTLEAVFESKPRKDLHEESFPWQAKQEEYRAPVSPVGSAPGPDLGAPRSYRRDVLGMLRGPDSIRNAVLLGTILGPPRSRRSYRNRSAMER